MEPRDYMREIYHTSGVTIMWYEENGEYKFKSVDYHDLSDKWFRFNKGWTNDDIHKPTADRNSLRSR